MTIRPDASFFIAGTIQGSERGTDIVDQSYRATIETTVRRSFPSATIFCPYQEMVARFGPNQQLIQSMFSELLMPTALVPQSSDPQILALLATFHEFVKRASEADVVIAYLPHHVPSMGTAIEMWAARQRGRCVICITEMRCNLAILSAATVIVPSVEAAGAWLRECNPQAT